MPHLTSVSLTLSNESGHTVVMNQVHKVDQSAYYRRLSDVNHVPPTFKM